MTSTATLEKPATRQMTLAGLQELLETDRLTFLKEIGRLKTPKFRRNHGLEDRLEELPNLFTIVVVPEATVEETVATVLIAEPPIKKKPAKKNSNEASCAACGDIVVLLAREGKKEAYTEDTIMVNGSRRLVYWCEPCATNDTVEEEILQLTSVA